eukprot:2867129-Lingulodinium_polyedra.AAC.1
MRPEHIKFVGETERERQSEREGKGRRGALVSTQTIVARQRVLRAPVPGARSQRYVSICMWHG